VLQFRRRRWTSRRSGLLRRGGSLLLDSKGGREEGREGGDSGAAASPQIRSRASCSGALSESSRGGQRGRGRWRSLRGGGARGERGGLGAHGGGVVHEVESVREPRGKREGAVGLQRPQECAKWEADCILQRLM
jgi:hypothetical protein